MEVPGYGNVKGRGIDEAGWWCRDKTRSKWKTKAEWELKDARAQSKIVIRICERLLLHIVNCKTAEEIWRKLKSILEMKYNTSLHIVQQQFYQEKFEDGDIANFLGRIQEQKSKLYMW